MSKLYIKDLERIKNGELVKFNFGYCNNNKVISLSKLNEQLKDLRHIRNFILTTFKRDVESEFDRVQGERIDAKTHVQFDFNNPFIARYIELKITTTMGDTNCCVSNEGLLTASFKSNELEDKISLILPYIKGLFNVKNNSNVLDEMFHFGIKLYNDELEHVLNVKDDGILLPFNSYNDLTDEELQDLLREYYVNHNKILENIIIPDGELLNIFRTNASKQKVLHLYEEGKNLK